MFGLELKDYLGIAGFGLSLAIWVRTLWRERRHIHVSVSPAFLVYANGDVSTQMASIDVVNRGNRPVYVKTPTLLAPNGQHLTFMRSDPSARFPMKLEDGQSTSLMMSYFEIAEALKKFGYSGKVKLIPCCKDATDMRHQGKAWPLDVDEDWTRVH